MRSPRRSLMTKVASRQPSARWGGRKISTSISEARSPPPLRERPRRSRADWVTARTNRSLAGRRTRLLRARTAWKAGGPPPPLPAACFTRRSGAVMRICADELFGRLHADAANNFGKQAGRLLGTRDPSYRHVFRERYLDRVRKAKLPGLGMRNQRLQRRLAWLANW